jgi:hypothetical protein
MSYKKTPSFLGFSAKNEKLHTVIHVPDGLDYMVDLIKGEKKWTIYEPESTDQITLEYVYIKSEPSSPIKTKSDDLIITIKDKKPPTTYNIKLGEYMKELAETRPDLNKSERMKLAQEMYRNSKTT